MLGTTFSHATMLFWMQAFSAVTIALFVSWRAYSRLMRIPRRGMTDFEDEKASKAKDDTSIIPLEEFDWRTTEPVKIRPFKPKYHLTMGLQSSTPSELIEMDKTYLTRLALRKEVIASHRRTVLQALPPSYAAIEELYAYLLTTYLPTRFPTMYSLSSDESALLNKSTSQYLTLSPKSPFESLQTLGENIDTDFLFLVPSSDGDGYILGGFICCFPSGFDTEALLGKKIRDIHGPVPGYKEKLEKSMYRSFDRLEVGKVVKRVNWSITTHDRLFAASGNHLYEGEEAAAEEIDINHTYLRCERQLVHRLPETKALIFSFKTYLTPLTQVKAEGLGEELATAIDGLKEGSVPAMHFYKRGVVWGEKVKEYLRS
ncbi:HRQ family 2 protein [Rutstroemia sp. NJR-2017a WRK4]|nr:HRQ family 2 protein [Rutstroemia sp. NJR-2017a WRK4]